MIGDDVPGHILGFGGWVLANGGKKREAPVELVTVAGCFSSMQLVFLGLKMVELLSRAELLF